MRVKGVDSTMQWFKKKSRVTAKIPDARLDVRLVLRVFNSVRDRGQKRGDLYVWQGMTASSDFDGYTLALSDSHCTVTVRFHNKYTLDSPNRVFRQQFVEQLKRIDQLR